MCGHVRKSSSSDTATALMANLETLKDEEIVFMSAEERRRSISNEQELTDSGGYTKYTAENVASIACFVAGLVQSESPFLKYCVFAIRNGPRKRFLIPTSWVLDGPPNSN